MANSDKATSLLAFESVLGLQTLSCVLKSGTVVAIWLPEKMAYQRVLVSHRFHGSFGCMGRILASDLQVMSLRNVCSGVFMCVHLCAFVSVPPPLLGTIRPKVCSPVCTCVQVVSVILNSVILNSVILCDPVL